MDVTLPDGTIVKDVPDNITKAELTAKLAKNGYDVSSLSPKMPEQPSFWKQQLNEIGDFGAGIAGEGAKFAGRLIPGVTGEELQAKTLKALTPKGQELNPEAVGMGETAADVGLGFGAGPILGAGAKMLGATEAAPILASGGSNLGKLTTGSKLANLLMRSGIGAGVGAGTSGLVNPEDWWKGALFGGTLSNVPAAIKAGKDIAPKLMQSAIKPTRAELSSGEADRAIKTLLQEDVSPTATGVSKLHGKINELNSQISDLIHNIPSTISKQKVLETAAKVKPRLLTQPNPMSDIEAYNKVMSEFQGHPLLQGSEEISVPLAQELKQGAYRKLQNAYGELSSAQKETQKGLARGLKEQIAEKVPAINQLNKRESDLINAANVAERRALSEGNKNPFGLSTMAETKGMFGLNMLDRSARVKALLARELYKMGVNAKSLEKAGLITVPSALSAENQGE
jgi:hypothetical protein